MPEFLPRILVVLTGLVAILALYVGITDYAHRKKDAAPATSESASTVVRSGATSVRKKVAKARRARTPATESIDAASGVPAEGDGTAAGKQIVGEAVGVALYDAPKAHHVQPVFDRFDGTLTSAACVPLPNSTKPGDVDATYYQNWAKEYGCKLN